MKTRNKLFWLAVMASTGLLWWNTPPLYAQDVPGTEASSAGVHAQQLMVERESLLDMLNDVNTPAERRATVQHMLEWNARGLTIAEVKKMHKFTPAPPIVVTPPAPTNNLAEATPLPAKVNAGGGVLLQNFPKGRDTETSAKAASSPGLVNAPQGLENAPRESATAQQAAGGLGAVSLVSRVPPSAQAAGQVAGGGAAGRVNGAVGFSSPKTGGAAAAGQSLGRGGSAPSATPAARTTPVGAQPVAVGTEANDLLDMSAFKAPDRNFAPLSAADRRYVPNATVPGPRPYVPNASLPGPRPVVVGEPDNKKARTEPPTPMEGLRMAEPQHKVEGAERPQVQELKFWDAACPLHGHYSGCGAITTCPKCEKIITKPGADYIR